MPDITMPRLSDTMEEGVLLSWHKKVGDQVKRGDLLAEIETDKAVMELEAYEDGVLERVLLDAGERVPIGTRIGVIDDGSGSSEETQDGAPAATAPGTGPITGADTKQTEAAPIAAASAPQPQGDRPKASPLARKIARERGVDLTTLTGTGPGGRIVRADVEAAAAASGTAEAVSSSTPERAAAPVPAATPDRPAVPDEDVEEVPLTTLQRVAARRLTESKQNAPHFYLTAAIDVTELLALRSRVNETLQAAGGPKVSVNDLVVKAVAGTLRAHPEVNVSFGGDRLLRHKRVHVGVAVAVPAGLVVPVVADTDRKGISEIAAESREKAERARAGKLRAEEMSGGTFTVSNLGMYGIEQFAAVINPPEAAILAVGSATDEVRVVDGEFVARKILRVTLSADHRAVDGATGAAFLQRLTDVLEHPLRILA